MKRALNKDTTGGTMEPNKMIYDLESSSSLSLRPSHSSRKDSLSCSDGDLLLNTGDPAADDSHRIEQSQRKISAGMFPVSEIRTTNQRDDEKERQQHGDEFAMSSPHQNDGHSDKQKVFQLFDHRDSYRSDGDNDHGVGGSDTSSVVSTRGAQYRSMSVNLCLVILVGLTACVIILSVGLLSVQNARRTSFGHVVEDVVANFETIFHDYMTLGLWTHQACLEAIESDDPHKSFARFWEYVQEGDFAVRLVSCAINVTHDERAAYENETRTFLTNSNLTMLGVDASLLYFGFKEINIDVDAGKIGFAPRREQSYYFPIHFVEPVDDPAALVNIDLDVLSLQTSEVAALETLFDNGDPVVTGRINRSIHFQEETSYSNFGVSLVHPGIQKAGGVPDHFANIPVSCNDILIRIDEHFLDSMQLKIVVYDTTPNATNIAGQEGVFFLCGGTLYQDGIIRDMGTSVELMQETPFEDSLYYDKGELQQIETIDFASREWTLVVSTTTQRGYEGQVALIAIGAILILVSTLSLSLLIYTNAKKIRSISRIKSSVAAEKTQIRLENARKAAQQERDLNDFIAHEVRNPLNAALAANTFVSASVNETEPLMTEDKRVSVREDVQIIDNSLHFINDLLRNMLDMQRAASHQLNIEWAFIDLKRDILEPVASMLYRRGVAFDVIIDCPFDHLIVESDSLRLKQVVLNLGRNAAKFVERGFVRLRADVVGGHVHIFIEDSGSGVPIDKQDNLFGRFQESLDSLNQGTGIGLALCKNLTELLGGRIWLDKDYDSGIEGCPGACFVVNLRSPPIEDDGDEVEEAISSQESKLLATNGSQVSETSKTVPLPTPSDHSPSDHQIQILPTANKKEENEELPSGLSVLFVDDDFTLRKLFVRAVARVTDGWNIDQASNGETALVKVEENDYDIIFVDQYMASTTKQLLGTETTRELRAKGCNSVIYGLSANDLESQFLEAGGDGFIMKPFPCKPEPLKSELFHVVKFIERRMNGIESCPNPVYEAFQTSAST